MEVTSFFDPVTGTFSYGLADRASGTCAVVDAVLAYDPRSGVLDTEPADRVVRWIDDHDLALRWILETHIHADHLSGACYLRGLRGGRVAIGERVTQVQQHFAGRFGDAVGAGRSDDFDELLADGAALDLGTQQIRVQNTPGHTPESVSFYAPGHVFVGDTLFMPDSGTARTDFPGGDARALYCSIQRVLELPEETSMHLCHDYGTVDRPRACGQTTVGAQRDNGFLRVAPDIEQFVVARSERDRQLAPPTLMYPALQFNVRGGRPPRAEGNGLRYFKTPLQLPDALLSATS
jgi:glyoxylase-like metal-dependent hydrolase (beta-lactamase superfamily II)